MSFEVGGSGETKSEPNVVPLCDILLVLLIIFMVISPVAQRGIDIQLPETQPPGGGPIAGTIVLTIEKSQRILLNQSPIEKDLLENRLKETYQVRPDKTIFIRADRSLTYNFVLSIIDIVKGAGVETLGVMTTTYETEDSLTDGIEQ
ncbi:MAG: biopolymer transporter ExbD [Candidatus Aminicenantes bacterium]|nr:biopolymer transporter ExbD [Candidatus Aminicenantes bacterium]